MVVVKRQVSSKSEPHAQTRAPYWDQDGNDAHLITPLKDHRDFRLLPSLFTRTPRCRRHYMFGTKTPHNPFESIGEILPKGNIGDSYH